MLRRQAFPFPAPGLGWISLEETAGGSSGPRENWDLIVEPSCKFSPLSGQLFFPPPFLLKIIEIPREGFLFSWASWGRLVPCHWPGLQSRQAHPLGLGQLPPPPPTRGSSYISCSLLAPALCGRGLCLVPERTRSSWRRNVILG